MVFLLWAMACTGSDEPNLDPDTYSGPVDLPVLAVDTPERAWFSGGSSVGYSGTAQGGTWDLTELRLNGENIQLDGSGRFSHSLTAEPGLLILAARLEDEGGERAVDARSVYHGPLHAPGAMIEGGVRLQVSPELLDDDDPDLDDLASIAELTLTDDTLLGQLVDEPIVTDDVTVTPTYIYMSGMSLDLEPQNGVLLAAVTIEDPFVEFDLTDIAGYSWLSTDGQTWMDSITVQIGLSPQSVNGQTSVEVVDVTTSHEGFGLELSWVPGFVEDFLQDWLEEELESQVSEAAQDSLPGLIEDLIDSLLVNEEIAEGLELEVELSSVEVATDGLRIVGDGRVYASGVDFSGLADSVGSLKTSQSPPDWPLSDESFSVALDDDLINQILFAMWAKGDLSGFSFSGLKIGALSGAPLQAPLGPADSVSFDMRLPPMVSRTDVDGMAIDVGIGEFRITFYREDGEVLDFSVNVRTGAKLEVNDGAELSMYMDNRPAYMTVEVGTIEGPEGVDPGDLAALIRLVIPTLLGNATNFLPDIELPAVAIGEYADIEVIKDLQLQVTNPQAVGHDSHWVIVTSGLIAE